jgi:hypothetical protein
MVACMIHEDEENKDAPKHALITLEMEVEQVERLRLAMAEGKLAEFGITRIRFLETPQESKNKDRRQIEIMRRLQLGDEPHRA